MNNLKVYKFIVNREKKMTPSLDTGCWVGGVIEFVSLVYGNLSVDPNSVKLHYTCKFDQSMLVLLSDEEELLKKFRFNNMYCHLYVSPKINIAVDVIAPSRYINLHLL